MKNKEITIIDLFNALTCDIAPKRIKCGDVICMLNKYKNEYENEYTETFLSDLYDSSINVREFFYKKIEILPEENDEWEDIEELKNYPYIVSQDDVINTINQLIKNQQKIIEKLESKNEN